MYMTKIDLKAEQKASQERAIYRYSIASKIFFFAMDFVAGSKHSLGKAKLLEMLASIPYREWEIKQYAMITRCYRNVNKVALSKKLIEWGRNAQDNEYIHLHVIHVKMNEDGLKDPWYLWPPVTFFIVLTYVVISKFLAWVNINGAYHFNAQFEDHAERIYAQMVTIHPEWEDQPVTNDLIKKYADVDTWADVFRRIGLDERDHRNESFIFCGKAEFVIKYKGMRSSYT